MKFSQLFRSKNDYKVNSVTFTNTVLRYDFEKIKNLLKKRRSSLDINQTVQSKSTILHLATRNKDVELVDLLLKYGANANCRDENGENCLHLAVRSGALNLVSLIVKSKKYANGADLNVRSRRGLTPLMKSFEEGNEHLLQFFLQNGADVSVKDGDGRNALHYAAMYGRSESVKQLLDVGMDFNEPDSYGKTPLHILLQFNKRSEDEIFRVACLLLRKQGIDVNAVNEYNQTPLFYAVKSRLPKLVSLLLKSGSDPDVHDDEISPLYLAVKNGDEYLVDDLLSNGADVNFLNESQRNLVYTALRNISDQESLYKVLFRLTENGLMINESDYSDERRNLLDKFEAYDERLKSLKLIKLCRESKVTRYNLLAARGSDLVKLVRDKKIRDVMNSIKDSHCYQRLFFEFADIARKNYTQGLHHVVMLNKFQEKFYKAVDSRLPFDVITIISKILSIDDLEFYLNNCSD